MLKTTEDITPQFRMVGAGQKLALPHPPPTPPVPTILHVQTSVNFNCVTLLRYIFARLRRNTFSFGNVTATEILTCVRGQYTKKYVLPLLM